MALHRGSMSRLLLAAMPAGERRRYLENVHPTLADDEWGLLTEDALRAIHQAGRTESFEEVDEGIWGTAASIRVDGAVIVAIGTAGPIVRLDAARRAEMATRSSARPPRSPRRSPERETSSEGIHCD